MEFNNISVIEESITCPITQMPMKDPVTGSDGQTYEKDAIVRWLNEKGTSPHDRSVMTIASLKTNPAIRFICDKYHANEFGQINTSQTKAKVSESSIILDHKNSKTSNNKFVMLDFNINADSMPKDLEFGHLSQDVILVIDRSGSMNMGVQAKDENNNNIENGMSIQDIVNHAAKTVTNTLDKNSRLAVIAFDNEIVLISDLKFMNNMNKNDVVNKIDSIKPRYQTNIWGGIEKAIAILDSRDDKTRNSAILMFTDGSPNISPARGEVETLKKLRIKKNFTAPIYTFGFGYNLQKTLLYDIAKFANGGNGHIPDGGMIATVFCNFIGTILCTVVNNLQIHFDNKQISLMGDFANYYNNENEELIYDIGTVQLEQARNIVLNIPASLNSFNYYYTYKIGGASYKSNIYNIKLDDMCMNDENINIHVNRYCLVESINSMINYNNINDNNETMRVFYNIKNQLLTSKFSDELTQGMIKNLQGDRSNEGQIKLAVSNMLYFKKWGEFYLNQLARSLNQQIKPNFKDEACVFGGTIFTECVDKASDIFDNLPPPTPSLINQQQSTSVYRSLATNPQPNRPINMSAYNNAGGGCFDSYCNITMADGSVKILKDLKKGDIIMSATQDNVLTSAKVLCVFETKITMGIREFVDFENGLYITPWHPIKYNNKWVFPAKIKDPIVKQCSSMITLVLDKNHVGFINGFQCIMLGHGFKEGVLNHPFYGTHKVIDVLKNNPGYEMGHILVNDYEIEFYKLNNITSNININKSFNLTEEVY
jgi:uncharacterized protein YegL